MTHRISIRSRLTAIVLAAASVAAMAGAAQAEDQRVAVGDLSQPAQARTFMHRLDNTARIMCDDYPNSASRAGRVAACKDAIHQEAFDQLSQVQRALLATQTDNSLRMAAQDR